MRTARGSCEGELFCAVSSFSLDHLAAAVSVPASFLPGAVAQLGERCVRNAEVRGSIPLSSTKDGGSKTEPPFSFEVPTPRRARPAACARLPLPNASGARVGGERPLPLPLPGPLPLPLPLPLPGPLPLPLPLPLPTRTRSRTRSRSRSRQRTRTRTRSRQRTRTPTPTRSGVLLLGSLSVPACSAGSRGFARASRDARFARALDPACARCLGASAFAFQAGARRNVCRFKLRS